ncbi:two-component system response regulator KdpE [Uliginosibacterium sp. H1]|uniref:two-component system response regulator KdpE n=1 Tax=Uliginosibacterium sp. H1 TaxID=3114757 RepID=UPI002E18A486|nr:two-component system response regulator KdpE [Uliginosibacterium sp. H1]
MNTADSNAPSIVLVEDEQQIRRFVRTALEGEGCHVFEAETMQRGLIEAGTRKPDLLILDLGLPDGDGVSLIRDVRGWSSLPILVLSARSDERDKVEALDAGADDFLTKPFGVAELMARVRALLRRQRAAADASPQVSFGEVTLDLARRVVTRGGEPLHLTPIEYRLLTVLVASTGRVLTHRQLLAQVWGPGHTEHNHYLRVYMTGLRRKLEADPAQPKHLLTETGVGYRFNP